MKHRNRFSLFFNPRITSSFHYIAAFFYSGLFVYLLFFARRRREIKDRYVTIVPFKSTINNYLKIGNNEHRELFNYYTNLIGNIVLFLPLPYFLFLLAGIRSFRKVFLISFILSLSVEVLQFVLRKGVADIDDILLNLLGTTLGFFLAGFLFPAIETNRK